MTHPDLLTDEDLATRHEPLKGWFNQYVCVVDVIKGREIICFTCHKELATAKGQVFFSCCPALFTTEEEAVANIDEFDCWDGEHIFDYMGTFEL